MKKLLWIGCLFGAVLVHAQEIRVSTGNAPQKVPFAQPFALQYSVTHTPGYDVSVEDKSFSPDFEVTQTAFSRQSPETGLYDFTVVPFTLGKSTFTVTFALTQNGKAAVQETQATPLEITPVKLFNDKKLREVRPAQVPANWLAWALILLALFGTGYVIYAWKKRLANTTLRINAQEDPRPNDEIALSKIEALLNSGLWERRAYKLFYITLTDILREYLWRQFRADTSADTSAELLRRAKTIPQMQKLLVPLKDFLNSGDLVKFAKAEPEETVRNKDVQLLREIVRETTPKPEVAPQEKKG